MRDDSRIFYKLGIFQYFKIRSNPSPFPMRNKACILKEADGVPYFSYRAGVEIVNIDSLISLLIYTLPHQKYE